MKNILRAWWLTWLGLLCGCSVFKKNAGEELISGTYKIAHPAIDLKKGFAEIEDSAIKLYPVSDKTVDPSHAYVWGIRDYLHGREPLKLVITSFDIDVLTIPFKFRPSIKGFPNQLNTNFSGALYAGHRTDRFLIRYKKDPLGRYSRKENHFGYSVGIFTGLGSTAINPWVTQDIISSEYDGLVFLNGIAAIIAVNNFSFGVGLGIDNLLDKNKKSWIYNNKPWVGLTIGLNLN